MFSILNDNHGHLLWTSALGALFALIFLVMGIARIVEFHGVGLTRTQKLIFIPAHILGCVLISAVMILILLDAQGRHKLFMNALFCSGMAILLPIHILIGLKRRVKLKDLSSS